MNDQIDTDEIDFSEQAEAAADAAEKGEDSRIATLEAELADARQQRLEAVPDRLGRAAAGYGFDGHAAQGRPSRTTA